MSKEDAERFLRDLREDKGFRAKVAKTSEKTLKLVRDHGYDVDEHDIRHALAKKHGVELPSTEEDGGADPMTVFPMSETPGY